jgi:hypothetical protein
MALEVGLTKLFWPGMAIVTKPTLNIAPDPALRNPEMDSRIR